MTDDHNHNHNHTHNHKERPLPAGNPQPQSLSQAHTRTRSRSDSNSNSNSNHTAHQHPHQHAPSPRPLPPPESSASPPPTKKRHSLTSAVRRVSLVQNQKNAVDAMNANLDKRSKRPKPTVRALMLIDIQNDFIDGSFPVPDAASIIPVLNRLRSKQFDYVYLCMDWHPFNHVSFRTNNPGTEIFQVVHLTSIDGGAQTMWPDHCVQGTTGAEIHPGLITETSDIVTKAGCNPRCDSYSAFKDHGPGGGQDLEDIKNSFIENKVTEIYAVGLATEYCVQYTVLDAKHKLGAKLYVVADGCRGISEEGVEMALATLENEKIKVVTMDSKEITSLPNRKLKFRSSVYKHGSPISDDLVEIVNGIHSEETEIEPDDTEIKKLEELFESKLQLAITHNVLNTLCSWSGRNVLHVACENGSTRIVQRLLEIPNLDLAKPSMDGLSALMLCVLCKNKYSRSALCRILLPRLKIIDLRYQDAEGGKMTALMLACRAGDASMVSLMLEKDSSLNHLAIQSRYNKTALMYACMSATPECAQIVEKILASARGLADRLHLLNMQDQEHWNPLHFASKSGIFALVDWSKAIGGIQHLEQLPINAYSRSGFTCLQLAAANGVVPTIRSALDLNRSYNQFNVTSHKDESDSNPIFECLVDVNIAAPTSGESELDLAIKNNSLEAARLLLRLGCHAKQSTGTNILLHRLVLMWDLDAVENILNFADANRIEIDNGLIDITKRMDHPDTCTFSFAAYTNSVVQHRYRCLECGWNVCLVCKDKCHTRETCRRQMQALDAAHNVDFGWEYCGLEDSKCECHNSQYGCQALYAVNQREQNGYAYIPNPLNTAAIYLTPDQVLLSKYLAFNTHNVWVQSLIADGWSYAKDWNSQRKQHNLLVPFSKLSESSKNNNLSTATETLKVIVAHGYTLVNTHKIISEEDFIACVNGNTPIDTASTSLPPHLNSLVQTLASNSHEVWAAEKFRQGWRYAPSRNCKPGLKLNSNLVSYSNLLMPEKHLLMQNAIEIMKAVICLGWEINKPVEGGILGAAGGKHKHKLSLSLTEEEYSKRSLNSRSHNEVRVKLFNQYLFAAVRCAQIHSIHNLLSSRTDMHVGIVINTKDAFGQTPLYVAAKLGHPHIAQLLLKLGANLEIKDKHGMTALSIASYLGNTEMCSVLVKFGADMLSTDKLGYTPFHHAAAQGNVETCSFFCEKLMKLHSKDVVDFHSQVTKQGDLESPSMPSATALKSPSESKKKVMETIINKLSPDEEAEAEEQWNTSVPKLELPNSKRESIDRSHTPGRPRLTRYASKWLAGAKGALMRSKKGSARARIDSLTEFKPLSLAVQAQMVDVAKVLIDCGSDPVQEDGLRETGTRLSAYIRALLNHIEKQDALDMQAEELQQNWTNPFAQKINQYSAKIALTKAVSPRSRAKVSPASAAAAEEPLGGSFGGNMKRGGSKNKVVIQDLELARQMKTQECENAAKMIEILNQAPQVRKWRKRFATYHFLKETSVIVVVILFFSSLVQFWPDANSTQEEQWQNSVASELTDKSSHVGDSDGWWAFLENDMFTEMIQESSQGAQFLDYNRLYGGFQFKKIDKGLTCVAQEECAAKEQVTMEVLNKSNLNASIAKIRQLRDAGWLNADTLSVSIDFNTFNEYFELYGFVSCTFSSSRVGKSFVNIETDAFRVRYKRFPPNRPFQLATAALTLLLLAWKLREVKLLKPQFAHNYIDYLAIVLLIVVLVIDIYLLQYVDELIVPEHYASDAFVDLSLVRTLLEYERKLFALFFVLSLLPVFKYIRLLPSFGPVIVALFSTMLDSAVIVYLMVVALTMGCLSIGFHVAFNNDIPGFGSYFDTLKLLIFAPFVEAWDSFQPTESEIITGLFPFAYYIVGTIIFNLLIAIVSDVYPKARQRSDFLWEKIITEEIEKNLRNRKPKLSKESLEIRKIDRDIVLRGCDGIRHWKRDTSEDNTTINSLLEKAMDEQKNQFRSLEKQVHDLSTVLKQLLESSQNA